MTLYEFSSYMLPFSAQTQIPLKILQQELWTFFSWTYMSFGCYSVSLVVSLLHERSHSPKPKIEVKVRSLLTRHTSAFIRSPENAPSQCGKHAPRSMQAHSDFHGATTCKKANIPDERCEIQLIPILDTRDENKSWITNISSDTHVNVPIRIQFIHKLHKNFIHKFLFLTLLQKLPLTTEDKLRSMSVWLWKYRGWKQCCCRQYKI